MKRILAAILLFAVLATAAAAGDYNWKQQSGKTIKIIFVQHTYAEGMLKKIPEFEALTGIKVDYSIMPEENLFDKLTTSLSSGTSELDVIMIPHYNIWQYAGSGFLEPLDNFLNDKTLYNPAYDFDDFFPALRDLNRWDCVPGHKVGTGNQWLMPVGFEYNGFMYNTEVFKEQGVKPPKTLEEMYQLCVKLNEFEGPGTYAMAVRGVRHWNAIVQGFITTFTNFGAKDMDFENGVLVSKVNSPESVAAHEYWLKCLWAGGPTNYLTQTWAQSGADFGARKAAFLNDADNLGYPTNFPGRTQESGKLAFAPVPSLKGDDNWQCNLINWGLGVSANSRMKDAAWLFVQYFTGPEYQAWSSTEWSSIDPPRKSVFDNPKFQEVIAKNIGFSEALAVSVPKATALETPHPMFGEIYTTWQSAIQDMYSRKVGVKEGLDKLKIEIDAMLREYDEEVGG
ncbi:MAG: sugar ABC transporter substrate-binding protein [Planctomycetota bacterium]|jgi:multiple sugar transport system substrate-binding protein|nr:sugar ABC transporter substrate-binding protein [Planctomycetota bacterium]